MSELSLDALGVIADTAEAVGIKVSMTPDQFRTIINEIRLLREDRDGYRDAAANYKASLAAVEATIERMKTEAHWKAAKREVAEWASNEETP